MTFIFNKASLIRAKGEEKKIQALVNTIRITDSKINISVKNWN